MKLLRIFIEKIKRVINMPMKKKVKISSKIVGGVKLTGRDKSGKVIFIRKKKNLITNAGYDFICDVIGLNAQPSDITYIAIGNGVAGDATATTLTSETDRQAGVYAHTPGTKVFTFTATFANVVATTEYGCLNAAVVGTLLNIAGFTAITEASLEIEVTMTLS